MDQFYNHLNRAVWAEIGKKIGQTGPGPKFYIWFRAGPGRARPEISISLSGRAGNFFSLFRVGPDSDYSYAAQAGPGSEKSGLCRPLMYSRVGEGRTNTTNPMQFISKLSRKTQNPFLYGTVSSLNVCGRRFREQST